MHERLAELAERAEKVTAAVRLDPAWQFQKARRVVRETLREDGVADQINGAVSEMLADGLIHAGAVAEALTA